MNSGVVKAEKTIIVAGMSLHDVLFLATGGITNLRKESCEPLRDKRVILFPDLGAEEIWAEKAISPDSILKNWAGISVQTQNENWEF